MIRRFLCLLSAILVCTSSVFAWSAESFVSDGMPYEFDSVASSHVRTFASGARASSDSVLLDSSHLPIPSIFGAVRRDYEVELTTNPSLPALNYTMYQYALLEDASFALSGSYVDYYWEGFSIPALPTAGDSERIYDPSSLYFSTTPVVTFDFSLPGTSDTLSLDFLFQGYCQVYQYYTATDFYRLLYSLSKCEIFLDGTLVQTYTGSVCDNSAFIHSSKNPVTSLTIKLYFAVPLSPGTFPADTVAHSLVFGLYLGGSHLSYDYLIADDALSGYNDEAQDSLNQHEQYESQWTGSMTENFNKLDISNFTFPSGLVSGFALITGIFQDIWNAMGEYKIVYVFPLTLGIVLLLIGRISRFAGRSSSRKSGGDDG